MANRCFFWCRKRLIPGWARDPPKGQGSEPSQADIVTPPRFSEGCFSVTNWGRFSELECPGEERSGGNSAPAALVAALAYLLMPVTYAEFSIMLRLVIPSNIEQTVHNIAAHPRHFAVGMG